MILFCCFCGFPLLFFFFLSYELYSLLSSKLPSFFKSLSRSCTLARTVFKAALHKSLKNCCLYYSIACVKVHVLQMSWSLLCPGCFWAKEPRPSGQRKTKKGQQTKWLENLPMRKDWEGWDGSPWRSSSSGQTSLMYKNIQMEGAKRMNPGSRVVATMRVAKSVERNTEDSLWKSGNTYFLWGWHEQVSQEDCEFFIQTFKGYLDTDLASLLWVTLLEWGI